MPFRCYQSQNYKIWKQFTTAKLNVTNTNMLLSITKLQNLKATHNYSYAGKPQTKVVINHKTTKFESNSQRGLKCIYFCLSCYQSQNYKIWKQFTTGKEAFYIIFVLLLITKLQNLKAIHNRHQGSLYDLRVVINHKTTKFESNSQLTFIVINIK